MRRIRKTIFQDSCRLVDTENVQTRCRIEEKTDYFLYVTETLKAENGNEIPSILHSRCVYVQDASNRNLHLDDLSNNLKALAHKLTFRKAN